MEFIADFHIHSKYSRATSRDCVPEILELWARRKGLALIGTGDFTHALWRGELKEKLTQGENGLFSLKEEYRIQGGNGAAARFILSAEISCIYKKQGKTRKVHQVILMPGMEEAEKLSRRLEGIGNLHSDGRPILGLDSRDLLEMTLDTCPRAILIPAHIWTPHFSLFGANSGFDSIEDCFGDLTPHIHALETGLSSDPAMNRRISALDRFTLVSNSDAHSPAKLAREANLFNTRLDYESIARALEGAGSNAFAGTLEFFPEEGKYHLDGHRDCKVCMTPAEAEQAGGLCPVCGKKMTKGVLHRVEDLADREENQVKPEYFETLIPLNEVAAAALHMTAASKKAGALCQKLMDELGPELEILRKVPVEDIKRVAGEAAAEAVERVRLGRVSWRPGYDGLYGKVTVL